MVRRRREVVVAVGLRWGMRDLHRVDLEGLGFRCRWVLDTGVVGRGLWEALAELWTAR